MGSCRSEDRGRQQRNIGAELHRAQVPVRRTGSEPGGKRLRFLIELPPWSPPPASEDLPGNEVPPDNEVLSAFESAHTAGSGPGTHMSEALREDLHGALLFNG